MNNHSFRSGEIKLFMPHNGDINPSQVPVIFRCHLQTFVLDSRKQERGVLEIAQNWVGFSCGNRKKFI